ncbi:MAG: acyltransferase [Lachnospiraceae bacterium]
MDITVKQDRQLNIDLLRILACFSVLMLHSASQFWYTLSVESNRWLVCNAYDAAFRFGVPIFVMISGRFFLTRPGETDIKRLYRSNILRLLTAYVIWSVIYGLWDCRAWMGAEGTNWKDYVTEILLGRYHLWYLPMMIGIYILLPVLKSWVDHCSKRNLQYFLVLFLVAQIGLSSLKILPVPGAVLQVLNQFDITLVCSYVGYFILCYYLYRYPLGKAGQFRLYVCGVLGLICAVIFSSFASVRQGTPSASAFDSFSVFTFAVTLSLYVFFQEVVGKRQWKRGEKAIREISADTFGIYLMHILVMEFLEYKGITTMSIDNILGIPLMAVGCFVFCGIVTAVFRRIPYVGKYIC